MTLSGEMSLSVYLDLYFGLKKKRLCLPDDKDMNPLPNVPTKNFPTKWEAVTGFWCDREGGTGFHNDYIATHAQEFLEFPQNSISGGYRSKFEISGQKLS